MGTLKQRMQNMKMGADEHGELPLLNFKTQIV